MTLRFLKHNSPLSGSNILGLSLVLGLLYLSTLYNFLLFHTLAELFSIVIAFGIFIVAWNTRQLHDNRYFLFLGIAYLFIGFLDLAHTRTYKGMMVFQVQDPNTPTQLWVIARYIESISLLVAPLFFRRRMNPLSVFALYTLVTGLLLWSIHADLFPVCFVEGHGITPFKKFSEYAICAILVGAYFMLRMHRNRFSPVIFKLLSASIVLTIFSELAFTFYVGVYDISNIIGHLFKFVSFYLIYKAVVETGLREPYQLLFRELKESEKKYRKLFANMMNGFAYHRAVLDENGHPVDHVFLEVNGAFEKMLGLKGREVIGMKVTEVFPGIQKDRYDWISEFGKVAINGETLNMERYFPITRQWYSFSVYSPEPGFSAAVFADITQRKQAELEKEKNLKRVGSLMAELERSNEELQQFANIVSHDLREPLRTVANFVRLLENRYGETLDDRARTFIRFAVDGTERMNVLLNDLLGFARLGGGRLQLQPVELNSVLDMVVQNLAETIAERKAEVSWRNLPVVAADSTQMLQLFQNLVANALKFNEREKPFVEIAAEKGDKEYVISIRDNGIGIAPENLERIFFIFQRLHGREEYSGTGVGLALCKKIIERHGGGIWAESTPGEGSRFYFTLPLPADEAEARSDSRGN